MNLFTVILNCSLFIMIYSLTRGRQSPKDDQESWLPSKISSIIANSQQIINQFRCPEKWSLMGGSCYYLSNYTSTAAEANHTCNLLHWKNSHLMHIRHPIEFLYAAHTLTKNNLSSLLIEIDEDLNKGAKIVNILSSNDEASWKTFSQMFHKTEVKFNKAKMKLWNYFLQINKLQDEETIKTGEKAQNTFKYIGHLRVACHQIKWNVSNNNSNVLLLTVNMNENKSVCSISNMERKMAYSHMCQYVVDLCFNNNLCGKNGECINNRTSFVCSCSYLYDGTFCEKFSHKALQIVIAIIIICVGYLLNISKVQNFLCVHIKRFLNYLRQQAPTRINERNNTNDHLQFPILESSSNTQTVAESSQRRNSEFQLSIKEHGTRTAWIGFLTIVFFGLLFGIPTFEHIRLSQIQNTNSSPIESFLNHDINTTRKCGENVIFRIENIVFLFIALLLVIFFSVLYKQKAHRSNATNNRWGIVGPFIVFGITDRFSIAAIVAIQTFEVLKILDEILIDIESSSQFGVLVEYLERFFFSIVLGFRYYPIMASFQMQDIFASFFTMIYILANMVYLVYNEMSCMHWLPYSKKLLLLDEVNFYTELSLWPIINGLLKNALHCLLMAYIGAQITIRFFYDSCWITFKRKRSYLNLPYRKIDQYSVRIDNQNNTNVQSSSNDGIVNQNNTVTDIKNFIKRIYQWDNHFRFTTIVICIYTLAFIFLFYLTSIVIFLYTTPNTIYPVFITYIFESMLSIEGEEWSFQNEVIGSAIIVMIFYAIQLLWKIKNYRKDITTLYNRDFKKIEKILDRRQHEIISEGIHYPRYLFQYMFGGYVFCFHLIFFIFIILKGFIYQTSSFTWIIVYLIHPLIVYLLYKVVIGIFTTIFTDNDSQGENTLTSSTNYRLPDEASARLISTPLREENTRTSYTNHGLGGENNVTPICMLNSQDNNNLTPMDHHSQDGNNLTQSKPYLAILILFSSVSSIFMGMTATIIRLISGVLVNILFLPRIDYSNLVEPLIEYDTAHIAYLCFLRWELLDANRDIRNYSSSNNPDASADYSSSNNLDASADSSSSNNLDASADSSSSNNSDVSADSSSSNNLDASAGETPQEGYGEQQSTDDEVRSLQDGDNVSFQGHAVAEDAENSNITPQEMNVINNVVEGRHELNDREQSSPRRQETSV